MIQNVRSETTWSILLYRVGFVLAQPLCIFWYRLPAKSQAPVEVPSVVRSVSGHRTVELKAVEVYGGDLWANYSRGLLNNAGQKWLKPTMEALAYTWRRDKQDLIQSDMRQYSTL